MNRAHSAIIRACSWLAGHTAVSIIGSAVIWVALAPSPAQGQSAVWQPQGATTGNIYYNGGNVGIGTASPTAALQVEHTSASVEINPVINSDVVGHRPGVLLYHKGANGGTSPAGARLGAIGFMGLDASNAVFAGSLIDSYISGPIGTAAPSDMRLYTNPGNGSALERIRIDSNGNVGIGTTNPQYKLAVNGNIGAQDIIVTTTGWSDYVFKPGYRLRPLSEVSHFIQANGHLPDIPTEAEVKEKGVSLGDMQAKLLAKVEELTLHMIQQEKENREARENLTKENQELRERLARLEKSTTTDSTSAVAK